LNSVRTQLPSLALALLVLGTPASAYPMPESSTARAARYDAWRARIEVAERAADRGEWDSASSGFSSVVDEGRALSDRSLLLARALDGLGSARSHERRLEEAAGLHEEAARLLSELLGESQPRVAVTFASLGAVYRELGRTADARAAFERAVSIFDRGPARESPGALSARQALAELASGDAQLEPSPE
jgi:tetratricopeptide (TPR) repeat protein